MNDYKKTKRNCLHDIIFNYNDKISTFIALFTNSVHSHIKEPGLGKLRGRNNCAGARVNVTPIPLSKCVSDCDSQLTQAGAGNRIIQLPRLRIKRAILAYSNVARLPVSA